MQGKTDTQRRRALLLNDNGLSDLINAVNTDYARDVFNWLHSVQIDVEPRHDANNSHQIIEVEGVHGYNGDDGFAYLNAEDVARGLGFTRTEIKNGKEYTSILWHRVNKYLGEFNFRTDVCESDYIPENMFYLLAMKANNAAAKTFQLKIANKILPSIRKYGYYVNEPVQGTPFDEEPKPKKRFLPRLAVVYVVEFENGWNKLGFTSDLTERIAKLVGEIKLDVTRYYSTGYMPLEDARQLEASLKAHFADSHLQGEFYSATFDDIRATLTIIDPRVYELRELAKLMEPCSERNQLLLQAATIINGKRLF